MVDLEKEFSMGRGNIYRIIKSISGKSLIDYIIDQKIERAVALLKTTQLNITEVMMECGFDNPAYFSRLFKKRMNISPREYREKVRREG
jgi:AraC-like DNA-binding protein